MGQRVNRNKDERSTSTVVEYKKEIKNYFIFITFSLKVKNSISIIRGEKTATTIN